MKTLTGKTVLVTGATGFLGGVLVHRLVMEGAHVRTLARRANRDRYIRDLKQVEIFTGDITDSANMREAVQGCDTVFHVAAALSGDLITQQQVNVQGTHNIAQAAAEAHVSRFVHISTISVYGYRNQHDVTEDTPMQPGKDAYSITKTEAEVVVRKLGTDAALPFTIIRPGMIYGPRSSMWTRNMFRLAMRQPTIWIGSGEGSTYPIYVDDVVDLAVHAATHAAAVGEVFNCTPDPSPTWREFLGAYASLVGHQQWLGIPPNLLRPVATLGAFFAPSNSPLKDLPDLLPFSQRYITYKMDKAQQLLDWQPNVSLKEGIQRCIPYLVEKGLLKNSI